ncbi:MAG: succinylglutamate desuccinylase/aspartoacylase family protein [Bryobacterales bacterium]|nr:succinylglutamate desuccinylase/aspartoacylase family protein [Bryobacterales bacterium]
MSTTQIHTAIDYAKDRSKQCGHLGIPYSHNLGGWANLQVPIAVIRNGAGPVVLLMAGNHGDEYPGQVAIMKLWRELTPQNVTGTLILIPCLNPPAAKASTRLSPLDGRNFNRCFPGNPSGTVSEMLAHYLSTVLFPMAEYVIDLHTGGRSMGFLPCAHMHLVPDLNQRKRMLSATEAFLTEVTFLYTDVAGTGLLPTEAEGQGKIVITTEMGGAEMVPASIHRMCQRGLRNVLVHCGVLQGKELTRQEAGLKPARWVQSLDRSDYRFAPESGLYENCIDLGDPVGKGEVVGLVHSLEQPSREPAVVTSESDGILVANRGPSLVGQGDCVACIAHDVDPAVLHTY